jgi:SAM-dependent methyltransferase
MAPDAVSRFAGFAGAYDTARPRPPAAVVQVICQWSGAAAPDVVDLGAGTGLSSVIWAGHAATVTAVEPSADMRAVARHRVAQARERPGPGGPAGDGARAGDTAWYTVVDGTAERTGLPAESADIVTASQAMHWFDAQRALPEIARILRPGGVLAAYDCDWPPCIDGETDAAYLAADTRIRALEVARGLEPPRAGKAGHLARMRDSGLFRHTTEIAVHGLEQGDGLGLTALREVAARRLPEPRTWWWTYRIRLAVR